MNFLYSNTGNGIVSSLMGSWVFWIVLLLIIVMIFVFVLKSNKSLQQNLHIEHLFTNENSSPDNSSDNLKYNTTDYDERENIREHLIHQINEENRRQRNNDDNTTINIEDYDDDDNDDDVFIKDRIQLTKTLPVDLNESQIENAKLLGLSGTNKKIKSIYTITGKREEIFKILTQSESIAANNDIVIVDDDGGGDDDNNNTSINNNSSDIKFKLELVNPSKITPESMKATENNFLNIYNQNGKCIITITFKYRQMIIDSISPFFDKVTINLDENIRLLMFKQIDNKLYLDKDHIAIFSIYDKIKYFAINSSIIKELQYAVK